MVSRASAKLGLMTVGISGAYKVVQWKYWALQWSQLRLVRFVPYLPPKMLSDIPAGPRITARCQGTHYRPSWECNQIAAFIYCRFVIGDLQGDGEFLMSFLVYSLNQRGPFLWMFACCRRYKERTFPQIVISAKKFVCICTIHTEKSTVYKILLRDWITRVLQFQIHNAYLILIMPFKSELIPFLLHMDK